MLARVEQIQQLRAYSEEALQEKDYDQAIGYLEEALRLDPQNPELAEILATARQRKALRERIDGYLRQAEGASQQGDMESARFMFEKALELDKNDSRVKAAYAAFVQHADEVARADKASKLLDSARNEMIGRRFTAALALLREAEQVDPANPQIMPLLQAAKVGQEQEQRRKAIEQIQNEVSSAIKLEDLIVSIERVNSGLKTMPGEPVLLKLRTQLERQVRELEARRLVDETVQDCRRLLLEAPADALALVRERLSALPGNARLLQLQASIEEQIAKTNMEASRATSLARAHEALDARRYREAVKILEACQADGDTSMSVIGIFRQPSSAPSRILTTCSGLPSNCFCEEE